MMFELSDSLSRDIIHALENQEQTFLVDAEKNELVPVTDGLKSDDERYYSLPEWTSEEGFNLRKNFADQLNSPVVKEQLSEVLHSGRGVFRNFRNVLREYPEVDKLWHKFKNQEMLDFVGQWYNVLREVWGLEKLDILTESDEDLVHDDFTFQEYSSQTDKEDIIRNTFAILNGSDECLPPEIGSALNSIWKNQFDADAVSMSGFVCRSVTEDFAGCILVKPVSSVQENVILLTNFFVSERYRGLGIGAELLSMLVTDLKVRNKTWLILPNLIIPKIIEPLLTRTGFQKIDFGYLLKL